MYIQKQHVPKKRSEHVGTWTVYIVTKWQYCPMYRYVRSAARACFGEQLLLDMQRNWTGRFAII